MPTAARLEPSRMTDEALYKRLTLLGVQISTYGLNALKASEVRAMGREVQLIAAELRLRGVQLQLAL